jgi:hypothetical protein
VKLPEPFVYFVDRSLGRGIVVDTLRATGHEVHAHDALFAQDTPDTEWLVDVGRRHWVVLTKERVLLAEGDWQKPPKEIT